MRWLQNSRRRSTHWDPLRIAWPRPRHRGRESTPRCRRSDAFGRFDSSRGRRAGRHLSSYWRNPGAPATSPMPQAPGRAGVWSRRSPSRAYGRLSASGLAVATGSFEHQPRLLVRQRHVPSRIAFSTSARTCSRVSAAGRADSVVLAVPGAPWAIWCWAAAKSGEPAMTAAAASARVAVKMEFLRMVNLVSC